MNLFDVVSKLFRVTSYFTVIIPLAFVAFIFSHVLFNYDKQIRFDEFFIVGGLKNTGYSEEVLVRHVVDKMYRIRNETANYATLYTQTDLLAKLDSFDIEVPGAGLSMKSVLNFMEQFFGIEPNAISGEIIDVRKKELAPNISVRFDVGELAGFDYKKKIEEARMIGAADKRYSMTLRLRKDIAEQGEGEIHELIEFAAKFILKNVEPLTLGLYLDSLGAYEEMQALIEHVEKTKKDENSLVVSYLLKSYLGYGKDNLRDANKYAELALKEKPNDMFALGNMGYLRINDGRHEEGVSIYKKMLEIAPQQYVSIYTNLADLLLEMNRGEEALPYIEQAIILDPSDFGAYLYRSEYYRRKGMLHEAEIDIERAEEVFAKVTEDDRYQKYHLFLREDLRENHFHSIRKFH